MQYNVFGPSLLNRLENSFNNQFESYVQLILLTGLGGYNKYLSGFSSVNYYKDTRAENDNGIDGYIKCGKNKYEIFSITGPKHATTWQRKFKKINEDYESAKKFCEDYKYDFIKWNMVINFNINEEQERAIIELGEKEGLVVEVYTPRRLIQLLTTQENYYVVAQGMGEALPININMEDVAHHIFADLALKHFIDAENTRSFDEKLDLIRNIRKNIYYRTFTKLTEEEIENEKVLQLPATEIRKRTEIHSKFCQVFQYYIDQHGVGGFYKTNSITKNIIEKNDEGFLIKIENLAFIFRITQKLEAHVLEKGSYKLKKVLNELARERRRINDISRKIN